MVNPQFSILAIPAIRGLALSLFLTTATAWTAPISIGQFDFGSAVVAVDFLGMVPGVPVGGFYAALGVELGPGFYSDAPPGVITNRLGLLPELPVQIDFALLIGRFGFEVSGSNGDRLTITLLDENGDVSGAVDFYIDGGFAFIGLADTASIRSVVIENLSFGEGQIYLRNLQFEPVPEPGLGAIVTITGGTLVLFARRMRRKQ